MWINVWIWTIFFIQQGFIDSWKVRIKSSNFTVLKLCTSLSLFKILLWLKIRGGWISTSEMSFLFSSRKKKTPRVKSERHVPSPESNSRGFRPNLSTQIAATTVTATYKLKIMSALLYIYRPPTIKTISTQWLFLLPFVIKSSCPYAQLVFKGRSVDIFICQNLYFLRIQSKT